MIDSKLQILGGVFLNWAKILQRVKKNKPMIGHAHSGEKGTSVI
jgi:hypothetical protein